MTKTVKKRLQAVVALLVTLMIMVGIMPSEALEGILKGTTVYADSNDATQAAAQASPYHWFYVQITCSGWTGNYNSHTYIYPKWMNDTVYANDNAMVAIHYTDSSQNDWGTIYAYGFTTFPTSAITLKTNADYPSNNNQDKVYVAKSSTMSMVPEEGYIYKLDHDTSGGYVWTKWSAYAPYNGGGGNTSDKSILVGVKYYNYFYDEQIAYEMAGGTDDPTSLAVTNGQAKNPYTLFNRAIMASDYGGNNTIGNHGSDGSGGNKTSYPVMYLGEFWVGGNAENGGSEAGSNYSSSPNDVSAGKYPRSVGVNDGGNTVTVSNHKGSNTAIDNDKLTNFTWGANLASRGSNSAEKFYHMLAQGLVDETLSMDPTSPNYLVPTINGQRIPYFDEKFLYYANPNNSSEIWNADLKDITGNGTTGYDVGHVYTSIFPFYRKDVTFEGTTAFTTDAWHDSWIKRSGTSWGRSLTEGTVVNESEYYTFNSLTDTVSVNTAGGASSDPGNATGGYGSTYWELSLDQAVANAITGQVFTQDHLDALVEEYSVANYNALGNTNRPIIEGFTSTGGDHDVEQVARAINLYKNGTMFTDAEVALLTVAGFFDNSGSDAGHVKDVDGKYGYFPFNDSSDGLSNLQYGFGTRLDIRFNINAYGTSDGKTYNSASGGNAPQIFRFTGDDDVWVFIDGQLVLDMGGGHKNGIGEINFAKKEAAVLYAGEGSSPSAWQDNVPSGTGGNGVTITTPSILTSIRNEADSSATGISEDHTLTMFYMERGKLNSNMSVMFNFKAPDIIDITPTPENPNPDFPHTPDKIPAPNPVTTSKLKIREITNIENVNPGLVTPTMKAAEDDVFKYTIQSNTVRNSSMDYSWVFTPTRDTYTRTPTSGATSTVLSPSGVDSTIGNDDTSLRVVYLDVTNASDWKNAKSVGLWDYHSSTKLHVGHKISDTLYAFIIDKRGIGENMKFMRSSTLTYNEGDGFPNNDKEVEYTGNPLADQRIFYMSGDNISSVATMSSNQVYAAEFLNADTNLSTLENVANVNYIWKEAFTSQTNTTNVGYVRQLTNTTTGSGTFNLLYGTSDDESSALFKNQFYDPVAAANATPSYTQFNVSQSMVKRNNTGTVVNNWTLPTGGRVMGKYYSTRISTVKRNVVVNNVAQTQTAELAITDGSYKADRKETELTNNIVVNSPDMDIIISNYINVANLYIRKERLKYENRTTAVDLNSSPEVANDEYYFKVYIWDVFGKVGNNVTDYSAVKYIIDGNTANQISMINYPSTGTADYGILKIKAGQTAAITGIPEGTLCWVEEMHKSELFKNDSDWNDNSGWEAEYNLDHNDRNPSVTTKIMTDQQTESTLGLQTFVQEITKDADGNTLNPKFTYGGVVYGWRVTGAQSDPQYERALYSAQNSVKNPDPGFSVNPIILIVEKVWDTTDTLEETTVKFVVEYQSVADGSPLSSDEADWNKYNYDNNHSDGIVTLSSSDLVSGVSPITWRKTLTSSAPDKADATHTYYYRIREWGKNDAVFVYKDGGFYSENFKAVYGAGTQDSPVTNIGSGDTTASASNSYKTVVSSESNSATTYTLTLQIKNEYRSTSIDPKPLPKTGAAGVYAIVTFGAFAITIAGVALLIYRKKLQTVNIYAVKGSEKPKE